MNTNKTNTNTGKIKFNFKNMKLKCNRCEKEENVILCPKIIPCSLTDQAIVKGYEKLKPKYTVMIKAICPICHQYIKFIAQDDDAIEEVNKACELMFQ